jgi:hypothetical protein
MGNQPEAVGGQVNEWLLQFKVKVCHLTQSRCEHQGNLIFPISIFYQK